MNRRIHAPTMNDSGNSSNEDLAEENLLEATREFTRWQVNGEYREQNGLLLVAGSTPYPYTSMNCVFRTDRGVSAGSVVETAREFFARRGRGFVFLLSGTRDRDLEALLVAERLKCLAESPCMLVDEPLPDAALPAGVSVETLSDELRVRDAAAINAEAYQSLRLPASEAQAFFGCPRRALSPRVAGFIAYRDGRPLSNALTVMSAQAAGVYWVGTALAGRRSGLAEACTRLATNAGFARGARIVTLQASPMGEPLYRRMGYRTFDTLKRYLNPAPA